jgi:hypothetical protein
VAILIDTSVFGRLANRADAAYGVAVSAIAELHRRGELLHLTPQNLVEFRNFATRPVAANGLGVGRIGGGRPWRRVSRRPFLCWRRRRISTRHGGLLVEALGVVGKQVHDARLMAVRCANGASHLLTFNGTHFARLAGFGPGVVAVDPASV